MPAPRHLRAKENLHPIKNKLDVKVAMVEITPSDTHFLPTVFFIISYGNRWACVPDPCRHDDVCVLRCWLYSPRFAGLSSSGMASPSASHLGAIVSVLHFLIVSAL